MQIFLYFLFILFQLSCINNNSMSNDKMKAKNLIEINWKRSCLKELNKLIVSNDYKYMVDNLKIAINSIETSFFNHIEEINTNKEEPIYIIFSLLEGEEVTVYISALVKKNNSYVRIKYTKEGNRVTIIKEETTFKFYNCVENEFINHSEITEIPEKMVFISEIKNETVKTVIKTLSTDFEIFIRNK